MNKQEQMRNEYEDLLNRALSGWKRTLHTWKESIIIDCFLMIITFIAGIILGVSIGGAN